MKSKKAAVEMMTASLMGVILGAIIILFTLQLVAKFSGATNSQEAFLDLWIKEIEGTEKGRTTEILPLLTDFENKYAFAFFPAEIDELYLKPDTFTKKIKDKAQICIFDIKNNKLTKCKDIHKKVSKIDSKLSTKYNEALLVSNTKLNEGLHSTELFGPPIFIKITGDTLNICNKKNDCN